MSIADLIKIANDQNPRISEIREIMKPMFEEVKPSFFTSMSTGNTLYGDLEEMIVSRHTGADSMSLNINEFAIMLIARMCNPYRSQRGEAVQFLLTMNSLAYFKQINISDIFDDHFTKLSMDAIRAKSGTASGAVPMTGVYSWRMAMFLTSILKDAPEHSGVIGMWSLALIS